MWRETSVGTKEMGHLLSIYYGPGMDHIIFFKFHDKSYMLIHYSNEKTEAQIIQTVKNLDFTPGPTQTEHVTVAGPLFFLSGTGQGQLPACGSWNCTGQEWFSSPCHHEHSRHLAHRGVWLLGGRNPASSSLSYFSKHEAQRQSDQVNKLTCLKVLAEILCFLQCQLLRIIRKILGRYSVNNVETHKKFALLLSFLNTPIESNRKSGRPECPSL